MTDRIENRIQKLRTEMGITQESLAETVGVTRQTIIALERGNYTPSLLLAMKIAKYFRASIEKVFNLHL